MRYTIVHHNHSSFIIPVVKKEDFYKWAEKAEDERPPLPAIFWTRRS